MVSLTSPNVVASLKVFYGCDATESWRDNSAPELNGAMTSVQKQETRVSLG